MKAYGVKWYEIIVLQMKGKKVLGVELQPIIFSLGLAQDFGKKPHFAIENLINLPFSATKSETITWCSAKKPQ